MSKSVCVRVRGRQSGWEKVMRTVRQNEWKTASDKTLRERHSEFHTPELAKQIVWPRNAKFNYRGKSCVSFYFLKLLEDFQEMLPPKSRYARLKECSIAAGHKESQTSPFVRKSWWDKKKWLFKKSVSTNYRIKVQLRWDVKRSGDVTKEETFCHFKTICHHYQYAHCQSSEDISYCSNSHFYVLKSTLGKEDKEEDEMRSTQNNWGKSCCVVAMVQVDLWFSCLSMRLQILRNSIQPEKKWATPPSGSERFLHRLCPCSFVTSLDFTVIAKTRLQKQRNTGSRRDHKSLNHAVVTPQIFKPITTHTASDTKDIQDVHIKALYDDVYLSKWGNFRI